MRAFALLLTLLLVGCGARPDPGPARPPPPEAGPGDLHLANGLRLEASPRPGAGVVALHLRLPAGTVHEGPQGAGSAQAALTAFLGDERDGLRADVARMGGQIAGWVTRDATAIEVVVAAEQLEEALARLADHLVVRALGGDEWIALAARLDEAQHLARRDDGRRAIEVVVADLFDDHPLARAPLPDGHALARLRPAQVNSFLQERYRPGGARLAVAGDTDLARARRAAEEAFGRWTGSSSVVQVPPPPPPGELELRILGTRAEQATLAMAFLAEAPDPQAGAGLDLLAYLTHRRLAAALSRAGVPVDRLRVYAQAPHPTAFLVVRLTVPADAIDAVWQVLVTAVVGEAGAVPPADAFDEARRSVREAAMGTGSRVEGLARRRAALSSRWPRAPADAWSKGLARLEPAAIAALGRKTLNLNRAAAVILAPDAVRTDDDTPWAARLVEQAFGAARPGAAPAAGMHHLGEGLTVVLHPMADSPTVGIMARIEGGAAQVPAKRAGLAALVAAGLGERSPDEPSIHAEAAPDHLSLFTEVPASRLGAALEALDRRLSRVRWTPARVERARERVLDGLDAAMTRGEARVEQLFATAARLPAPEGTATTLEALSPVDVRAWYRAQVREAPLVLVLTGQVDAALLAGLGRRFGPRRALDSRPVSPKPDPNAGPPPQRTLDGADSFAMVGFSRALESPGDVLLARVALELLTHADAPLHRELVSMPGVAVHPFLRIVEGRLLAGVHLRAPRGRSADARTALDAALDKLVTLPVDPEALEAATRRLRTQARVGLRDAAGRARWLAEQVRLQTPYTGVDALDRWGKALSTIEAKAVEAFVREAFTRARRVEARVEGSAPKATP